MLSRYLFDLLSCAWNSDYKHLSEVARVQTGRGAFFIHLKAAMLHEYKQTLHTCYSRLDPLMFLENEACAKLLENYDTKTQAVMILSLEVKQPTLNSNSLLAFNSFSLGEPISGGLVLPRPMRLSFNFLVAASDGRCCFCGESKARLKQCGGCGFSQYCSTHCQRNHWRSDHQQFCRVFTGAIVQARDRCIEEDKKDSDNVEVVPYLQIMSAMVTIIKRWNNSEQNVNDNLQAAHEILLLYSQLQKQAMDCPVVTPPKLTDGRFVPQLLNRISADVLPYLDRKVKRSQKKSKSRRRRQERKKTRAKLNKLNEDALQDIECAVCFEEFADLVTCPACQGSGICVDCRAQLTSCPLCRAPY